jgi:hypothetical protein
MRVLHFYKTYYPDSVGGVEQVIRQMCVGTGRLGVTNEVLTLSRESGPAPDRVRRPHRAPRAAGFRNRLEPVFRSQPSASWRAWRARPT